MKLDLKSLYKTLSWHERDRQHTAKHGESVGLFIQVPEHIANQFPKEGKSEEDLSPPHITLLYIGDLPEMFEEKLNETVEKVCSDFKCFNVKLGNVRKFINEDGQKVYHSPIKSNKLQQLHETLKLEFQYAQLPFSLKYPTYKPHITIAYVNPGDIYKYSELCPQGSWEVDSVWIWGTKQPKLYFLK